MTLFVMELEVALSLKIVEKTQNRVRGTLGLCAEGTFLFQFSRKYDGVTSDSVSSWK